MIVRMHNGGDMEWELEVLYVYADGGIPIFPYVEGISVPMSGRQARMETPFPKNRRPALIIEPAA